MDEVRYFTFSDGFDPLAALLIGCRDEIKRERRQRAVAACYAI